VKKKTDFNVFNNTVLGKCTSVANIVENGGTVTGTVRMVAAGMFVRALEV